MDITHPNQGKAAVENITWPDIKKMKEGEYSFYVRCFASRGGKTGFRAEIEFDGNIYSFNYDKPLHQAQSVAVAKVMLKDGFWPDCYINTEDIQYNPANGEQFIDGKKVDVINPYSKSEDDEKDRYEAFEKDNGVVKVIISRARERDIHYAV